MLFIILNHLSFCLEYRVDWQKAAIPKQDWYVWSRFKCREA